MVLSTNVKTLRKNNVKSVSLLSPSPVKDVIKRKLVASSTKSKGSGATGCCCQLLCPTQQQLVD